MDNLPQDPAMLFSYINMLLRDRYESLEALCDDMGIDPQELKSRLAASGWEYNPDANKFW